MHKIHFQKCLFVFSKPVYVHNLHISRILGVKLRRTVTILKKSLRQSKWLLNRSPAQRRSTLPLVGRWPHRPSSTRRPRRCPTLRAPPTESLQPHLNPTQVKWALIWRQPSLSLHQRALLRYKPSLNLRKHRHVKRFHFSAFCPVKCPLYEVL